jgi:hypothetical protein
MNVVILEFDIGLCGPGVEMRTSYLADLVQIRLSYTRDLLRSKSRAGFKTPLWNLTWVIVPPPSLMYYCEGMYVGTHWKCCSKRFSGMNGR